MPKAATVNRLDLEGYQDNQSACSDVCGTDGADNIWSSFIFPQRTMYVLSNIPVKMNKWVHFRVLLKQREVDNLP